MALDHADDDDSEPWWQQTACPTIPESIFLNPTEAQDYRCVICQEIHLKHLYVTCCQKRYCTECWNAMPTSQGLSDTSTCLSTLTLKHINIFVFYILSFELFQDYLVALLADKAILSNISQSKLCLTSRGKMLFKIKFATSACIRVVQRTTQDLKPGNFTEKNANTMRRTKE